MKRNKSNRVIAILCAIVMFAEQIWGSGLYVNAAGETDAQTVSEAQQDQTDVTDAAEPASEESTPEADTTDNTSSDENAPKADAADEPAADDTTAPVTDQDNEEKKDETPAEDKDASPEKEQDAEGEEASAENETEEEVAVEGDDIEVSEEKNNDEVQIPGIGTLDNTTHTLYIGKGGDAYNVSVPKSSILYLTGGEGHDDTTVRDSITSIEFDANAKMSILPQDFMKNAANLTKVDMTNAKSLQEIDLGAFAGCKKLTDVKLGTVTTVKPDAFLGCIELPEIDLCSVAKIGNNVFDGCAKLKKVILRKNLSCETFQYYNGVVQYQSCFVGCDINEIEFAAGMSVIPGKLFMGRQVAAQRHVFADDAVIEIPQEVNDIGESAFAYSNIKKVVFKDAGSSLLRGINAKAFFNCEDLVDLRGDDNGYDGNTIHFPKGIQQLHEQAFEGCKSITRVVLPATITNLYKRVFYGCEKLEDLTLGTGTDKATTKEEIFMACIKLKTVKVPEGLKALGPKEFYNCYALETITFEGTNPSIKYIGDYCFSSQQDQAATYAENMANKITAADMPDSITELGAGVFANCIKLVTAHVPQSLTSIPKELFRNCFVLTTADLPNAVEKIGDMAFCKCEALVLNNEAAHVASKNLLPTTLTEIGANAFNQCEAFPYIIIPEKVTTIGAGAFGHCMNAAYIKFETKVLAKVTGVGTFDNNVSVSEVIFADGVTSIPANLFWGAQFNTNTCHIVIPKTVTEIGINAFSGESINRFSTLKYISFEEGSALKTIQTNAFRYNSSMEAIILPDGLEEIKDGAFANTDNLKGIIIPESVTFIGVNAFAYGKLLANVEIRAIDFTTNVNPYKRTDTAQFITTCIFYNSNIRTVIIGNKVASFPDYLFLGAKFSDSEEVAAADLVTLPIPKSVKSLGDYCLPNVVNLKEIQIEEGSELERIGQYAFLDCKNLININIPDGVTEIDQYAFSGCKRLGVDNTGEFKLPAKLENLGKGAFAGCLKLGKSVTLPAGLKTVNDEVFKNCEALEAIIFLCAVPAIGESAFEGCSSLTEVFIPYGVETIGASAFKNCTALTKVVIPNTVTAIGTGAFEGCDNAVFYVTAGSKALTLLKAAGIPEARIHVYTYKITYELYGGTNDPQNPSGFEAGDQPIALKPATRAGSTFMGWFEDEALTKEVKNIEGRSADVNLYAKWVTEEYPITYVLRGGTNDPENPATYTMWTEDITLKAPTLKGATFQGWFTDLNDTKSQIKVIKKGTSGPLTLYAKWNGRSTALPTANITSGSKVKKGSILRLYCTTPGAVVYYSVSYEDALPASPEAIPANEYKGGIVIEKRVKIRAMAVAEGYLESDPVDLEYDILDENSYWGDVIDKEDQDMWSNPSSVPANIWVAGVPAEVEYTGEAITFNNIRVYDHKTLLTEGVDYTISYKNNKKIADKASSKAPTVLVKGKGSYSGSYPHTFTIKSGKMVISAGATAIKKNEVVIKNPMVNYNYAGDYTAALGITVTSAGKQLVENTDYIIVYGKNKAGTVKATVKGIGSYKGKVSKKFTVKPADISKALVCFVDDSGNEVSANSAVKYVPTVSYQKGGAQPKVQVYIGERRLIKGVDYTVEYAGNTPGKNATSNAMLKIVGKGNYSGTTGGIGFTVVKGVMSDIALGASGVKFSAKGVSKKDIKIVAIDTNGKLLSKLDDYGKPLDYTVKCTYVLNGEVVELGDTKVQLAADTPITVTITGENNYSGSVSTTCTVYSATIDKAKVKVPAQEYTGMPVEPGYDAITVTVKGTPLTKSEYSIVGYISNTKKGNAKVYLAGYGSYGGLKAVKFKIKAKKMVK